MRMRMRMRTRTQQDTAVPPSRRQGAAPPRARRPLPSRRPVSERGAGGAHGGPAAGAPGGGGEIASASLPCSIAVFSTRTSSKK